MNFCIFSSIIHGNIQKKFVNSNIRSGIQQPLYYRQQKSMEKIMEPFQITVEILNKIGRDFIRRYQLKQQISTLQLKDDTNDLIEQLRFYNRTIKQLKLLSTPQSILFDQKFNEVVFRVLNSLSGLIYKLINKCKKLDITPKFQQTLCDFCRGNLNSKKIKNIQKQILDYFPILGSYQLPQKERQQNHNNFFDDGPMSEQIIQKKMMSLQRNLQERQSGLIRSIQQFQNFRNDLIIGLPKLNSKDGFYKFDVKEYAFQMGVYFQNNLKKIENKISVLKTVVRKTQQQSVQCCLGQSLQNQKNITQIENSKFSVIKAQNQIKKLIQIKGKLQEGMKSYQIQLKSLKQQLRLLQEKNIDLKQENYLQKMKKIPRQKHNKPILYNWEEKNKKVIEPSIPVEATIPSVSPTDLQVFNQISSQIAEIRSQIESTGTKMEDVFPVIKNSVKKAINNFLNQRMSSTMPSYERRKLHMDNQQDSILSGLSESKKKIHGSSFKGVSNFYHKKEIHIKGQNTKNEQIPSLAISTQLNYKISNNKKSSINRISILDQKVLQEMETKHIKSGISIYKKSLFHTEGNLIPRKLITKMSDLTSQFKQNNKEQKSVEINSFYKQNIPAGLYLRSNSNKQFYTSSSKLHLKKKYRKNISCEDLVSLVKNQPRFSLYKDPNLINIKKINSKKIPYQFISSFLQSRMSEQNKIQYYNQGLQKNRNGTQEVNKNQSKQLKKQIKQLTSTQKKKKLKSIIVLKLDEISYLTMFFTLMAQAHVSNPSLYFQLKEQIFSPHKNKHSLCQNQETILRELVSEIILVHRKCDQSKDKNLCRHLSQFIQAFQSCLNIQ